jgi:hypothetical protein
MQLHVAAALHCCVAVTTVVLLAVLAHVVGGLAEQSLFSLSPFTCCAAGLSVLPTYRRVQCICCWALGPVLSCVTSLNTAACPAVLPSGATCSTSTCAAAATRLCTPYCPAHTLL